jgi:hypothetical protein
MKYMEIFFCGRSHMGETRNAYSIFVGKPEARRPIGQPRRRWGGNNRMYVREIGWEVVDWMHLAQDKDQ